MKRRPAVAHVNFQLHRNQVAGRDLAGRFRYIFETNLWGSPESRSGLGSALAVTEALGRALPDLFRRFEVRRLLDIPCGDFGWLSGLDLGLDSYLGADIVPELVHRNTERYAGPGRSFAVLDLTSSVLPAADMVLCRDCLVHLSFERIHQAMVSLNRSGSRYLLATTFPEQESNQDIEDGDWRPLNVCKPPFDFPPPFEIINERCTEAGGAYADKSLGLWLLPALPDTT